MIVRNTNCELGVNFFTPDEFSHQLVFIHYAKGKMVEVHLHNPMQREVFLTQEVLHIKKGRLELSSIIKRRSILKAEL
jgi:hypothetical protein